MGVGDEWGRWVSEQYIKWVRSMYVIIQHIIIQIK
jgi:hypothetical protein